MNNFSRNCYRNSITALEQRGIEVPSAVLVVDIIRPEEKKLWHALSSAGFRTKIVNINQEYLTPNCCVADVAVIRSISMFKSVYSAAYLEAAGLRAVNPSQAILIAGDKILTYSMLKKKHLPVVNSILAMHPQPAERALKEKEKPLIDKPPIGSWGRMVALIRDNETARIVVEHREYIPVAQAKIHLIQDYIEGGESDIRCFVVGGETIGCMRRKAPPGEWRSNVALGASTEPLEKDDELYLLSKKATEYIGLDYGSVDIIKSRTGELYLNEVNGVPEFKGIEKALKIDIAMEIAKYIKSVIKK